MSVVYKFLFPAKPVGNAFSLFLPYYPLAFLIPLTKLFCFFMCCMFFTEFAIFFYF